MKWLKLHLAEVRTCSEVLTAFSFSVFDIKGATEKKIESVVVSFYCSM
jgi:hypothetical protein